MCTAASTYCPQRSSLPLIAEAGKYTNSARTSTKPCEAGHYCLNGEKKKCPKNVFGNSSNLNAPSCDGSCPGNENKFSPAGSTRCSCLGSFVEQHNENGTSFTCECRPGHFRDVGESLTRCTLCKSGSIQPSHSAHIKECTPCGTFEKSNEDRTECVTDISKLLPVILFCILASSIAICLTNKRISKYKAKVKHMGARIKSKEVELIAAKKRVKELIKLSQPTKQQESIFEEYRRIVKEGDDEALPFKIKMYSMEIISLEKSLGKGAYGEVFKGKVNEIMFGEVVEKHVALKQLHIKSEHATVKVLDSFIDEIRNLSQVGSHENIVKFFGVVWDADSFPSIVLEFVAGGELTNYLVDYDGADKSEGLASPTLLSIAIGIVRGIKHIHGKKMIHRDLKPQNILLDCSNKDCPPVPLIADFGGSRKTDTSLTMTYVGTAFYVAPEIFRGERYGQSADIFSLGIILNQIDTLQSPGTGVNFSAMNSRNPGSARPLKRSNAPLHIARLLDALMSFDISQEYGVNGDLSFGRPSIDSVLVQLERLEYEDLKSFERLPIRRKSSIKRQETAKSAEKVALIQRFLRNKSDILSEHFKNVPSKELHMFAQFLETEREYHCLQSTLSEKKTLPLAKGLKLSLDARSLDEFLGLIHLDHFKQDILDLGIGTTIMELANSGYTRYNFFDAIEGMKRPYANRLARRLSLYKKKREEEKNKKAQQSSAAEEKGGDEEHGEDASK